MKQLIYFEPLTEGHCASWASILLQAAANDPRVSGVRLVASRELVERLGGAADVPGLSVEILTEEELEFLTTGPLISRGLAQWQKSRELLQGGAAELFLPFFDHALYGAILDRRQIKGHVSGIIFRPPNNHNVPRNLRSRVDSARRWMSYVCAHRPHLRQMFTLDQKASRFLQGLGQNLLVFAPDPAPDLSLLQRAKSQINAGSGRSVMLLFGALSRRKGIFKVLEALEYLSLEERSQMEIRFIGRLDPADRIEFLDRFEAAISVFPEIRLTLKDKYLSDEELAEEVLRCNMVVAPYQNHMGSSGVLFWAAAAGKPLICQNTHLIGWQVEEYTLGKAIDTTDPEALARAFASPPLPPIGTGPFLSMHEAKNFSRMIIDGMFGGSTK